MNEYGLRILEDKHNVVSISLSEILDLISNKDEFNWVILFLDATGNLRENHSLASLEQQIKKSKNGIYITLDEMYESCEIVIRMVDSSYWKIYFHNKILFEKFEKRFAKTEWINIQALKDLN